MRRQGVGVLHGIGDHRRACRWWLGLRDEAQGQGAASYELIDERNAIVHGQRHLQLVAAVSSHPRHRTRDPAVDEGLHLVTLRGRVDVRSVLSALFEGLVEAFLHLRALASEASANSLPKQGCVALLLKGTVVGVEHRCLEDLLRHIFQQILREHLLDASIQHQEEVYLTNPHAVAQCLKDGAEDPVSILLHQGAPRRAPELQALGAVLEVHAHPLLQLRLVPFLLQMCDGAYRLRDRGPDEVLVPATL
mmetsp:Transcript_83103/g.214115  ORF Transcript_83103/g.214115 Transcript_83103/m.214115 type:complete len:249 (-) Transcript_83103:125-871(-)